MKFEVSVSGWEDAGIEDTIVASVVQSIADSLEEKVSEAVTGMVEEAAQKIITERLTTEIDAILEAGWVEKGDSYYGGGNKHFTLREKIEDALKPSDRYNHKSLSKIVSDEIQSKFDKELKDGTARLRTKIDEVINTTIEETITGDIRAKIRRAIAC